MDKKEVVMVPVTQSPEWTSFDVIKGLFRYLPEEKPISSSRPELHTAIFEMTQISKFSPLLKDYVFERNSHFPFSRELNIDILNLEQSGHLSADNPDFVDYKKKPKLEKTFELYTIQLFNEGEISLIKEMAELFLKKIH